VLLLKCLFWMFAALVGLARSPFEGETRADTPTGRGTASRPGVFSLLFGEASLVFGGEESGFRGL
jgi:hypothetical protein